MPGRAIAAIFGVRPGIGGLGVQVANALRALATGSAVVHAIGPAAHDDIVRELGPGVIWHVPPDPLPQAIGGRWRAGAQQLGQEAWAAGSVAVLGRGALEHLSRRGDHFSVTRWPRRADRGGPKRKLV